MAEPTPPPPRRGDLQVLQLLADGHSRPSIACQLGVTVGAVDMRLCRVYRRLGVTNAIGAVQPGLRAGLVTVPGVRATGVDG